MLSTGEAGGGGVPNKATVRTVSDLGEHSLSQERSYIPEGQRYSIQNTQAAFCFSETIPAPTGKEEARQKSVSGLHNPAWEQGLPRPRPWAAFSSRWRRWQRVVEWWGEGLQRPADGRSARCQPSTLSPQDTELLRFSLLLIQSWLGPMQSLSRAFTSGLLLGISNGIYEKLKDLEEGIQALMRVGMVLVPARPFLGLEPQ